MMTQYKVAVLMASYNGINWLPDQIKSILNQYHVDISLFISDDFSHDGSYEYLQSTTLINNRIKLLPQLNKFGSAGNNFYRLIRDVKVDDYDYIAYADQDDIWEQDKLIRHISLINEHKADAVSSNVTAFWAGGKEKLIVKSQPQRRLDFLFESAGPGCTFLMTPWLLNKVRDQLLDENSPAKNIALHDWLSYAVCRAYEHEWIIDTKPTLKYRQHENNVVGANSGFKAKWVRLTKLRQGWYRAEVTKVSALCVAISGKAEISKITNLLNNKNIISQLKLLYYVSQARRKTLDRLVLFILVLCFLF